MTDETAKELIAQIKRITEIAERFSVEARTIALYLADQQQAFDLRAFAEFEAACRTFLEQQPKEGEGRQSLATLIAMWRADRRAH